MVSCFSSCSCTAPILKKKKINEMSFHFLGTLWKIILFAKIGFCQKHNNKGSELSHIIMEKIRPFMSLSIGSGVFD
jgi:hypothetical protein